MNGLISQTQTSHRRVTHPPSIPVPAAMVFAAALIATVISGCGHKSTTATSQTSGASGAPTSATSGATGAPSPEAQQLLQDSSKATKALHSLHVNLATTNITTLPMESVDADVTNQPEGNAQAVGNATVRMQPKAPVVSKQFLVTKKTMYTKDDSGKYTSLGPAEKIYDPGIIMDKDKGLGNVIGKVASAQIAGKETIDGVATVKVTGTIDAAVIDPVVPQLGKGGGTLPVTLYITDVNAAGAGTTATSGAPAPSPNLVRMVIDKDQGHVTITLSAWGAPVTIPNPTG
ncbi:LppX_LprAFG lipoprotein [Mycobacterium gastri]|uniref:Diacylated glycolipid transporter LprF n=1 Tax=Mycobacterium gastri TaxID=1777 RepID=A0A1X1VQ17_MYCGS|nr:LppX_LprAFG lipoprotein [Mycobacterium gastri]ORV71141.1 hypothetical protein AWC07_00225 [Mycobacterium gastri]